MSILPAAKVLYPNIARFLYRFFLCSISCNRFSSRLIKWGYCNKHKACCVICLRKIEQMKITAHIQKLSKIQARLLHCTFSANKTNFAETNLKWKRQFDGCVCGNGTRQKDLVGPEKPFWALHMYKWMYRHFRNRRMIKYSLGRLRSRLNWKL